jgi:two-component system, NtrC family, sensor kinase
VTTSPRPDEGTRPPGVAPAVERYDLDQIQGVLPQLIDALNDPVLVVDRQRRVVGANRRYLEIFGAEAGLRAGVSCANATRCPEHAVDGGETCAACAVIADGQPRRVLHLVPDASGAQRRWEGSLNPVRDRAGAVTHVVEVWRDITERSQLEGQLAHGERLATIGQLAAGVAHEINNPMASILAGVESLARWLERAPELTDVNAEEAREVLGMLERETLRSREIVNKLLLLAQPYTGRSTWVDVNQAARDTISLLRYTLRRQNVEAVEELAADSAAVWGRESGIRGVWMNLCLNAVQAMPEGGTLTVRTRGNATQVVLEVEDTGAGIAPAHLMRIWDPFFTTKPTGKGTGLGLSITRTIVEKHGGAVAVDSPPGRGARFTVTLPREGNGGERV